MGYHGDRKALKWKNGLWVCVVHTKVTRNDECMEVVVVVVVVAAIVIVVLFNQLMTNNG